MQLFLNSPPDSEPLPYLTADQAMVDRDFATAEKTLEEFKDAGVQDLLSGIRCAGARRHDDSHRFFETLRPDL